MFFKYRIPKLRTEWLDIGKKGELKLLALEPNEHSLEEKGINSKGVSSRVLTYKIIVEQIFYQTFWFKSFAVFLLAILSILWDSNRRTTLQNRYLQKVKLTFSEHK